MVSSDRDLKAYIIHQYFANRVPEKKIHNTLTECGILISPGQISNIITKANALQFTQEKEDIFTVGMESSDYFHIDDTGARHNGINHYVQVICTELFSSFFINRRKNKAILREILGLSDEEQINKIMMSDDAKQFMFLTLSHALCWVHEIRHYQKINPVLDRHEETLHNFLGTLYDFYEQLKKYKRNPSAKQKRILEDQLVIV